MCDRGRPGTGSAFLSASGMVARGRVNLWSFTVDNPSAVNSVEILDGVDSGGRRKFLVGNAGGNPEGWGIGVPIYCDLGLYVNISAGTPGVTVQFEPLSSEPPTAIDREP